MKSYDTAEGWYADQETWRDETAALRDIVLGAGLTETVKWKHPCYMDNGRNIVIISCRKNGAVAGLLKGALLDDPKGLLVQPGIERSARYLHFANVQEITEQRPYFEGLITQAVQAERAGLRVEPLPDEIDYVEELQQRMAADDAFREAFEGLTRGRRRGYNLHFAQPKRSSTREARITRCTERIMAGKGLRDCICGHSKRPPGCDGSHKHL